MEFGISTYGWSEESLGPGLLERIYKAGFRKIELFANRPHFDYAAPSAQKNIATWFMSNDVAPPILHLPFFERTGKKAGRWISALAPEPPERNVALDETKRALEMTDRIDIGHLVVHLGIPRQSFHPIMFEYAYSLIRTISEFTDVPIRLETLDNEVSTIQRLREFLEVSKFGGAGICYDTGHRRFQDELPEFDRVEAVHLNDNNGDTDEHTLPFEGSTNWQALVDHMVSSGYSGPMIVEANTTDLDQVARVTERMESLVEDARSSIDEFRNKYNLFPAGSENS
jgi:sugar phosphate isomerase/epimerase